MDYYPGMVTDYLEKVSPEIVDTVIPMFVDINDISDENLQWILDRFEENEAGFTALSSPGEYQIAKHMVRVMMQVNVVKGGRTDPLRYRDRFMAENTLWVADFMGEGAKIALWAHNGHVSNDGSFRSMGRDLKKELEDNYQMIGFSFSIGSFTARKANGIWDPQECVIDTVLSGSTNYIFHNAQYENFILKMADIPAGSSLSEWMRDLHSFLMVGATYDGDLEGYYNDYNLSICYDVIIHFDETEASHLIPL
jgi:erythromycin esterase